ASAKGDEPPARPCPLGETIWWARLGSNQWPLSAGPGCLADLREYSFVQLEGHFRVLNVTGQFPLFWGGLWPECGLSSLRAGGQSDEGAVDRHRHRVGEHEGKQRAHTLTKPPRVRPSSGVGIPTGSKVLAQVDRDLRG